MGFLCICVGCTKGLLILIDFAKETFLDNPDGNLGCTSIFLIILFKCVLHKHFCNISSENNSLEDRPPKSSISAQKN